jgi:hypothetical protein
MESPAGGSVTCDSGAVTIDWIGIDWQEWFDASIDGRFERIGHGRLGDSIGWRRRKWCG